MREYNPLLENTMPRPLLQLRLLARVVAARPARTMLEVQKQRHNITSSHISFSLLAPPNTSLPVLKYGVPSRESGTTGS
jgi:hypothetical protein